LARRLAAVVLSDMKYRLTSVETVREEGSWLFTVKDGTDEQEVILVPCTDGEKPPVRAWFNRCTHEATRLHRQGVEVVMRDGDIICPKHGSAFDSCSGGCDNGPAAETTLWNVEITVENGDVYLTDDDFRFSHEGATESDDDELPGSTSHLQF